MAGKNSDKPKEFGGGFDKDEYTGPMTTAPGKGQEGWDPNNPHVSGPRDPLEYLKEQD